MRAGIFYFSLNSSWDRSRLVADGGVRTIGFVRVEEVEAVDLAEALDLAKPREDEHVMNTHALDPHEETEAEKCPKCGSPNWAYEGDRQVCTDCRLGARPGSID